MNKIESVSYQRTLSFKTSPFNRDINQKHYNQIMSAMAENPDIFPPITVNYVTDNIIDGQHRLMAYQQLVKDGIFKPTQRIQVKFIDVSEDGEKYIIMNLNTHTRNWTVSDYIQLQKKRNNPYYIALSDFCETHDLTKGNPPKYNYGAAMIAGKNVGAKFLNDGCFTCTESDIKRANIVHDEIMQITSILGLNKRGRWIQSLAVSWSSIRDQHPMKAWVSAFKRLRRSLIEMPMATCADWNLILAKVHLHIDKKNSKKIKKTLDEED